MNEPFYFTDRALKFGFNITLENHHINLFYSSLTLEPNFTEFGIEFGYINEVLKQMSSIYA